MFNLIFQPHVTEKSIARVENVFGWLKEKENLDSLYSSKHDTLREDMVKKLELLIEKDAI